MQPPSPRSRCIDAIQGGTVGAIAVAYVEFACSFEVRTVLDWSVIRDQASAQAFADKLAAAPRSFWGRTAISAGVDRAVQLLAESGFEAPRRMIDVCGDGTNNAGRDVTESRDDAVKAGITINGLAIINDHPVSWTYAHVQPPGGLPNYYRENVTGGPGSFVLEVHDFHTFGEAMTRKLVTEIAEARYACGEPGRATLMMRGCRPRRRAVEWSRSAERRGNHDGSADRRRLAGAGTGQPSATGRAGPLRARGRPRSATG